MNSTAWKPLFTSTSLSTFHCCYVNCKFKSFSFCRLFTVLSAAEKLTEADAGIESKKTRSFFCLTLFVCFLIFTVLWFLSIAHWCILSILIFCFFAHFRYAELLLLLVSCWTGPIVSFTLRCPLPLIQLVIESTSLHLTHCHGILFCHILNYCWLQAN